LPLYFFVYFLFFAPLCYESSSYLFYIHSYASRWLSAIYMYQPPVTVSIALSSTHPPRTNHPCFLCATLRTFVITIFLWRPSLILFYCLLISPLLICVPLVGFTDWLISSRRCEHTFSFFLLLPLCLLVCIFLLCFLCTVSFVFSLGFFFVFCLSLLFSNILVISLTFPQSWIDSAMSHTLSGRCTCIKNIYDKCRNNLCDFVFAVIFGESCIHTLVSMQFGSRFSCRWCLQCGYYLFCCLFFINSSSSSFFLW